MSIRFSLVCPCFNEEAVLAPSTERIVSILPQVADSHELILSDDGSSDSTPRLIAEMEKRFPCVRGVSGAHGGKGAALTRGFREARGEVCAFLDVDLELAPEYLIGMMRRVEGGEAIVIGSKCLEPGQGRNRSAARKLSTRIYNLMVHVLLNSPLRDHQAGIKMFRRDVVERVIPGMRSQGWIWDTEFLVRAQAQGFSIGEIAVEVSHQRMSKVNVPLDSMRMFWGVMGLLRRGVRVPSGQRVVHER